MHPVFVFNHGHLTLTSHCTHHDKTNKNINAPITPPVYRHHQSGKSISRYRRSRALRWVLIGLRLFWIMYVLQWESSWRVSVALCSHSSTTEFPCCFSVTHTICLPQPSCLQVGSKDDDDETFKKHVMKRQNQLSSCFVFSVLF